MPWIYTSSKGRANPTMTLTVKASVARQEAGLLTPTTQSYGVKTFFNPVPSPPALLDKQKYLAAYNDEWKEAAASIARKFDFTVAEAYKVFGISGSPIIFDNGPFGHLEVDSSTISSSSQGTPDMAMRPKLQVNGLPSVSENAALSAVSPAERKTQVLGVLAKARPDAYPLYHEWEFWHERSDESLTSFIVNVLSPSLSFLTTSVNGKGLTTAVTSGVCEAKGIQSSQFVDDPAPSSKGHQAPPMVNLKLNGISVPIPAWAVEARARCLAASSSIDPIEPAKDEPLPVVVEEAPTVYAVKMNGIDVHVPAEAVEARRNLVKAKEHGQDNGTASTDKAPASKTPLPYEDTLVSLMKINSIQKFWQVSNNFDLNALHLRDSIHLFKKTVKPVWEDPRNVRGGSWTFRVNKSMSPNVWKHVQMLAIGETLQEVIDKGDDICGVSLSVRFNSHLISVWNRDASNEKSVEAIKARVLKELPEELRPTPTNIYYKQHSDHKGFSEAVAASKAESNAEPENKKAAEVDQKPARIQEYSAGMQTSKWA
ncbi:MAG: hypothetical protein M1817_005671 [Caeruleum heppii]|nr:MAG: hypothetical protein M1817_005671 [Caeruleum heppii]